jgi:type I restriction enzyme S subunit
LEYNKEEAPGRARKVVYTNDVIFATIRPTLKRIAKIDAKYDNEYCSTAFCVLRPQKGLLDSEYLYQYLQTENFIDRISKLQSGASYPAVRDENVKSMLIPIPEIGEQSEIGNALKTIDQKIVFHRNRKQVLQSFFKLLLNRLMTGQIRVMDLDFDISSEALNTP